MREGLGFILLPRMPSLQTPVSDALHFTLRPCQYSPACLGGLLPLKALTAALVSSPCAVAAFSVNGSVRKGRTWSWVYLTQYREKPLACARFSVRSCESACHLEGLQLVTGDGLDSGCTVLTSSVSGVQ